MNKFGLSDSLLDAAKGILKQSADDIKDEEKVAEKAEPSKAPQSLQEGAMKRLASGDGMKTFKKKPSGFSSKQIKQAAGIVADKRYSGGNMTGAVKTMDKVSPGISDHPKIKKQLQRHNEEIDALIDLWIDEAAPMATQQQKAGADRIRAAIAKKNENDADRYSHHRQGDMKAAIKARMKERGLAKEEIERFDELSRKTLGSYSAKASDAQGHRKLSTKKVDNRYSGVALASKKLDKKNMEEDYFSERTTKFLEDFVGLEEKKKLDKVDHKALKGSHAEREDGDIDNDGDEDDSDKYLHNRRKTVKKAMESFLQNERRIRDNLPEAAGDEDPKGSGDAANLAKHYYAKAKQAQNLGNSEMYEKMKRTAKKFYNKSENLDAKEKEGTKKVAKEAAVTYWSQEEIDELSDIDEGMEMHLKPESNGTHYKVHAVGKKLAAHGGIKVGERLSDTEVDDARESGIRVRHVKEEVIDEASGTTHADNTYGGSGPSTGHHVDALHAMHKKNKYAGVRFHTAQGDSDPHAVSISKDSPARSDKSFMGKVKKLRSVPHVSEEVEEVEEGLGSAIGNVAGGAAKLAGKAVGATARTAGKVAGSVAGGAVAATKKTAIGVAKGAGAAVKGTAQGVGQAVKRTAQGVREEDDGWYAHREMHGDKGVSKDDWKKGIRMNRKGERVNINKPKVKEEYEAELEEARSGHRVTKAAKSEPEHIAMQLRKVQNIGANHEGVHFNDGKKERIHPKTASQALQRYNSSKPADKEEMQKAMSHSHAGLKHVARGGKIDHPDNPAYQKKSAMDVSQFKRHGVQSKSGHYN